MTRRIAFLRIAQETNALSPVPSEVEDFRRTHYFEGDELLRMCGRFQSEAPGFTRNAELSGFLSAVRRVGGGQIEPVPLFSAWAIPAGKLSTAGFVHFQERIERALDKAGKLDGVFVALHGAMLSSAHPEPEASFLQQIRDRVGPDVPIVSTLDLHAHLSTRKMKPTSLFTAYRTNPHRDHAKTGQRGGEILIRTVLGQIRPTVAWRTLPMVLGGGSTLDFMHPTRGLFRWMSRAERDRKVLYLSLLMCHIWNDAPDNGWATHVITDNDPALAERLADELADLAWNIRQHLPPEFPDPSEAIRKVRAAWFRRKFGVVCMSDASDMVGAGSPGENPALVRALIEEAPDLVSYAAIRDTEVVERLKDAPIGERVSLVVGGKLQPDMHPPLTVTGFVRRHGTTAGFGKAVVLDLGHVKLVVTEAAPMVIKPSFYGDLGLPVWKADICVVKSLFPFRLYFLPYNRMTLYAKTRGATDFDAALRLPHDGLVHPVDQMTEWREADRRRRAL